MVNTLKEQNVVTELYLGEKRQEEETLRELYELQGLWEKEKLVNSGADRKRMAKEQRKMKRSRNA